MSKDISALLLKAKIDSITSPGLKKQYLINCLERQGFIKRTTDEDMSHIVEDESDICNICKTNTIFYSNHEATCDTCGTVKTGVSVNPFKTFKQDLNIGRGTFIQEGAVNVKIMKDGKEVIRDLSRVNMWVNTDPEEDKIRKSMLFITEVIDNLATDYPTLIFESIKQEIIEMWYIVINEIPDIRGPVRKSLAIWCIYYPIVYNNLNISIQKLGRLFDIQIGDVMTHNWIMKGTFENTKYKNYIAIKFGSVVDLELDNLLMNKLERVKKNIRIYEEAPLGDKQVYGIIYEIAKKLSIKDPKYKKYTLPYMSKKTGLSQSIISTEASKYKSLIR